MQTAPLLNEVFDATPRWMKRGGLETDVVLSSRVRLARNLRGYNFPQCATVEDLRGVRQRSLEALEEAAMAALQPWCVLPYEDFTGWERQSLIDRHLSSAAHVSEEAGRALAARPDGALSVLVNEEDHVRLQSMWPGLQLGAAWSALDRLDDQFEAGLERFGGFAYQPGVGYLTACPTNSGTGMRASVMLHLCGLHLAGRIEKATTWVRGKGLTLRGTFGEGSEVLGHLFQLSNQVSLGVDEKTIVAEVEQAAAHLCAMERKARAAMEGKLAVPARDRVGRAVGVLRHAHSISCHEASECLSYLRLGHELDWVKGLTRQRLNELMVWIRPSYMQVAAAKKLTEPQRDLLRASLLRDQLGKVRLELALPAAAK